MQCTLQNSFTGIKPEICLWTVSVNTVAHGNIYFRRNNASFRRLSEGHVQCLHDRLTYGQTRSQKLTVPTSRSHKNQIKTQLQNLGLLPSYYYSWACIFILRCKFPQVDVRSLSCPSPKWASSPMRSGHFFNVWGTHLTPRDEISK